VEVGTVKDVGEGSLAEVDSLDSAVGRAEAAAGNSAEADNSAAVVGTTVGFGDSLAGADSRVVGIDMPAVVEAAGSLEAADTVLEVESQVAEGPAEDLAEDSLVAGLVGNSAEGGIYQAAGQADPGEAADNLEAEHNE